MAGQHDVHKHQIAVKFHHRVFRQIEKAAEEEGITAGEFIRKVVSERVNSVEMTSEDAFIIANRIKDAEKKGRMV